MMETAIHLSISIIFQVQILVIPAPGLTGMKQVLSERSCGLTHSGTETPGGLIGKNLQENLLLLLMVFLNIVFTTHIQKTFLYLRFRYFIASLREFVRMCV